jgi:hypothetical protein
MRTGPSAGGVAGCAAGRGPARAAGALGAGAESADLPATHAASDGASSAPEHHPRNPRRLIAAKEEGGAAAGRRACLDRLPGSSFIS